MCPSRACCTMGHSGRRKCGDVSVQLRIWEWVLPRIKPASLLTQDEALGYRLWYVPTLLKTRLFLWHPWVSSPDPKALGRWLERWPSPRGWRRRGTATTPLYRWAPFGAGSPGAFCPQSLITKPAPSLALLLRAMFTCCVGRCCSSRGTLWPLREAGLTWQVHSALVCTLSRLMASLTCESPPPCFPACTLPHCQYPSAQHTAKPTTTVGLDRSSPSSPPVPSPGNVSAMNTNLGDSR